MFAQLSHVMTNSQYAKSLGGLFPSAFNQRKQTSKCVIPIRYGKVVVRTSTRIHYSGNVQYYHCPVQSIFLGILLMLSQCVSLKIVVFLASFAKTLIS
jgi:hypothetical protein